MDVKQLEFGDRTLKMKDEEARKPMTGATTVAAGKAGQVPAPPAGFANRYLCSDGTWKVPPDTNTTYGAATQSAPGLMSASDKAKLDGIAAGAQANPGVATASANGLMSAADKIKLNGIAAGANVTPSGLMSGWVRTGQKSGSTIGNCATAEGNNTVSSGHATHAEGFYTTASGDDDHAEGYGTVASGGHSHAEGNSTTASGQHSHAEGISTVASGHQSHAEGDHTIASNCNSHAMGQYNVSMPNEGNASVKNGHAFVIGNGSSDTARSNAFSVMFTGVVKAKSTITASTNADYAELFEWADGNLDGEDRVGRFVTLEGDKIRIADESDGYILGIVSGAPFVLGNGDCDVWNGMHLRDEFGRLIMEPAPKIETVCVYEDGVESTEPYREPELVMPAGGGGGEPVPAPVPMIVRKYEREVKDENGETVFEGTRPVLNPEYDHTQPYISRLDRPEWAPVGMLGVLTVIHDGTLEENGFCMCSGNGIATKCDLPGCGYRVIRVISDSLAKVVFRDAFPVSAGKKLF